MYTIPFFSLEGQHQTIEADMKAAFSKTLKKGRFILDEQVIRFEDEWAVYQKSKYCVSVGNGHDAIFISLKALGVGQGDEVLVPSHTCHATWLAIVNAGATPVPVEVELSTYTIDASLVENSITKKTKAIVPVHLYGQPCTMDKIMAIAKKNNLLVVEDNAQAHGAFYKSKMTGSWGNCNATSFYPTKNLGALGDGGAITTSDKRYAEFARAFRNYGSSKKDFHSMLGVNSRLDEVQAALLRIKLGRLSQWNSERRKNAALYFESLANTGDIQLPPSGNKMETPVFHQFVIQTDHRDKLKKQLETKGIETAIHYATPIHLQKAYGYLGYKKGSLPIAERLSKTVLSLPIWPGLKQNQMEKIGDEIRKFY